MTNSHNLNKETIFRNSKFWYEKEGNDPAMVSGRHIDFCRKRSGRRILDFGCATGNYCLRLKELGFECVGADINEVYIKSAQQKGVEAYLIKDVLPFEDKSFDTVIMFELLEHVQDLDVVLKEAKRVARKNILLSVPNNTQFYLLKSLRLTYEHMLALDHAYFFTKQSLSVLLGKYFSKFYVLEAEPIFTQGLLPWYIRKAVSLGIRLGLVKPVVFYWLFAECIV
jgi:2-polyprenyl-3-methyl-5-hydroxy-6-metoxy-1,4-benzoquinol methylase